MALGKYSRVDGRKSSSFCSTVTIVVFVALCLVGVWMLMSSSVVPVQNSEFSNQETENDAQQTVIKNESKQFEDSSGDLPDDTRKGEDNSDNSQDESNTYSTEKKDLPENESENTVDNNQEQLSVQEKSEENTESREEPNSDAEKTEDGNSNSGDGDTDSEGGETKTEGSETKTSEQTEPEDNSGETKSESDESEKKSETEETSDETKQEDKADSQVSNEVFPAGAQSEILNETTTQNGAWSTQAAESENEKESQQSSVSKDQTSHGWKLCNAFSGADYIPCLDNLEAINKLTSRGHFEHRERHCPDKAPTCLVPLPEGYKSSVKWPKSRDTVILCIYWF